MLPVLDAERLMRLTAFANRFHCVIPRADQRERLALYLRGLLDGIEPKNAEAIAARWAGNTGVSGIAQSLQHFLGTSPWDADRFFAEYRALIAEGFQTQSRLWLVQELIFPKKGRQSVGTQRQLARPVGRKINCQVAVAVSEYRTEGFFPLAIRLYLPGYWLREHRELADRLVPAEHQAHLSRSDIAIRLIDQLRGEGQSVTALTADSGFLSTEEFTDAMIQRGVPIIHPFADPASTPLEVSQWENATEDRKGALAHLALAKVDRGYTWLRGHLGLDQFEGRNWLGWHHHVALVFAAYGFLVSEGLGSGLPPFPEHFVKAT